MNVLHVTSFLFPCKMAEGNSVERVENKKERQDDVDLLLLALTPTKTCSCLHSSSLHSPRPRHALACTHSCFTPDVVCSIVCSLFIQALKHSNHTHVCVDILEFRAEVYHPLRTRQSLSLRGWGQVYHPRRTGRKSRRAE
jgi:hypothetical protein